jgi:hypothetical protein
MTIKTIKTVITNLNNTIDGKEQMIRALQKLGDPVSDVVIQFVEINLLELKRIREDVISLRKDI